MGGGLDPRDRDALRRLGDVPTVMARELKTSLGKAADKAARKTRQHIMAAGSHHPGDLRREIANTVTSTEKLRADGASVTIKSLGQRMPGGKSKLNAYSDAHWPYQRWRHPVFGRPGHEFSSLESGLGHGRGWTWVTQEWPSARGWFTDTLTGEHDRFLAAAQAALDETARKAGGMP